MFQKFDNSDFKELKIKLKDDSKFNCTIHIKQHNVREKCDLKPEDRTLFAINLPPLATEDSIKNIFSGCGEIEAVYFHKKPTASLPEINKYESKYFPRKYINGYKVAYIVFKTTKGLNNSLKLKSIPSSLFSKESTHFGLKGYYQRLVNSEVNVKELSNEINIFMEDYDKKQMFKDKLDSKISEADEDGWVTVTKKGRNPGFSRSDLTENKILNKEKIKNKKRYLQNFYSFQIRESKLKHLEAVKKKFEEDKRKINLMKETRKFKPF